ncbi:hypothetical protein Anapl_17148 [Anas platyrhynchos]|uniref:Uncharacterized protein n=1 Tax=Anas platyrhynchos TaxID=8839 RepID=R0JE85_ANAPL|nr:hypothetical protein Anapl_17148 [Anas platyrhynchos]
MRRAATGAQMHTAACSASFPLNFHEMPGSSCTPVHIGSVVKKQRNERNKETSLGTKTVLVTLQLILLLNNRTVYEPEMSDQIEVKVWDSATKNDKVAAEQQTE